eukprot:TRINITY_DN686_c0_g3_i1.p1 TRINITY_DN686_c0_g3~~TRINITY_DN686_c0_g3_i1.p1  ORF type:complete len:394 (-),score=78.42 TRINITY_DN686_c0_g3_i1:2-1090(-)
MNQCNYIVCARCWNTCEEKNQSDKARTQDNPSRMLLTPSLGIPIISDLAHCLTLTNLYEQNQERDSALMYAWKESKPDAVYTLRNCLHEMLYKLWSVLDEQCKVKPYGRENGATSLPERFFDWPELGLFNQRLVLGTGGVVSSRRRGSSTGRRRASSAGGQMDQVQIHPKDPYDERPPALSTPENHEWKKQLMSWKTILVPREKNWPQMDLDTGIIRDPKPDGTFVWKEIEEGWRLEAVAGQPYSEQVLMTELSRDMSSVGNNELELDFSTGAERCKPREDCNYMGLPVELSIFVFGPRVPEDQDELELENDQGRQFKKYLEDTNNNRWANGRKIWATNMLQKKKKYRLRGRSSETAKAHRG